MVEQKGNIMMTKQITIVLERAWTLGSCGLELKSQVSHVLLPKCFGPQFSHL